MRYRIQFRDDGHQRPVDLPTQCSAMGNHGIPVAGAAGQDVAQEVASVLALDRAHRQLLGDRQRGHCGRAVEDMKVGARAAAVRGRT